MSISLEGFDGFIQRVKSLEKATKQKARIPDKQVSVGVLGKSGSDLVTIAAANEYGTSDGHIPSRPFLRTALRDKSLVSFVRKQAASYFKDVQNLNDALSKIGIFAVGLIQKQIGSSTPPPNKLSTIKRKGSSATLIDTGRLRQSISWEIK